MYHKTIRQRIRQQGILHSAMLELTYKCNLDCFFCYNDRELQGTMLRLKDYQTLLKDLEEMQVLIIALTGGEPLLHPDFFAIGRAARERGFVIRIKSGGHAIAGRVARRIRDEINPYLLELSLHGATAATHDKQTRVAGSFERLIKNIREMQRLELRVSLVSTLTRWNAGEIGEMFELADELGLELRFQGPVGPRDNGDTTPLQIQPSQQDWEKFTAIAGAYNARLRGDAGQAPETLGPEDDDMHCGLGAEEVLIDPYGNVYPCLHLRRSAGNIHRSGIRSIWERSKVFSQVQQISRDAARRVETEGEIQTLGAPVFCPGLELQGCRTGCGGCASTQQPVPDRLADIRSL